MQPRAQLWTLKKAEYAKTNPRRKRLCMPTTTKGQEAPLKVNKIEMLIWMYRVAKRDMIGNEHIKGTPTATQSSKK